MILTKSARSISIREVQQTVARAFDLSVAEMLSDSLTRRVAGARHIAMYLSREVAVRSPRPVEMAGKSETFTRPSFPRIGLAFARDHSSVIHACRAVKRRLHDDLNFALLIDRLTKDVREHSHFGERSGGRIMEVRRSLIPRANFSTADYRTGIDSSRAFSKAAPPIGHAGNGVFGDRLNQTKQDSGLKRIANVGPRTCGEEIAGRSSMIDQLTELIGNDGTMRLVAAFGGTRIYVPQTPEPEDTLSESIGHVPACALARIYGGERIEVPNPPPRRLRILELRASGLSIDAIARALGCTRRRVFQVMADARAVATDG